MQCATPITKNQLSQDLQLLFVNFCYLFISATYNILSRQSWNVSYAGNPIAIVSRCRIVCH